MDRSEPEADNDGDQTGLYLHILLVSDAQDDDHKESSAQYLIKSKIQHRNL